MAFFSLLILSLSLPGMGSFALALFPFACLVPLDFAPSKGSTRDSLPALSAIGVEGTSR